MTTTPPEAPDEGGADVTHAVSLLQGLMFEVVRKHGADSFWTEILESIARHALGTEPDTRPHETDRRCT